MSNVFVPIVVLARLDRNEDILELIDTVTGKTVLEVGTDTTSDNYYPCFVSVFSPENMASNAEVKEQ